MNRIGLFVILGVLAGAGSAAAELYFYEATPDAAITDNGCTGGFATSTISVPDDVAIDDLDVGILATHPWRGDVVLRLLSPEGTEIVLYYDTTGGSGLGDSANNLYGTFDEQSLNIPGDGYNDLTANYDNRDFTTWDGLAETDVLNLLIGESSLGTWTLKYCDKASSDTGSLDAWALFITVDSPATTTTTMTTTTSTTHSSSTSTSTTPASTTTTTWGGSDDDADDDADDDGWNGDDDDTWGPDDDDWNGPDDDSVDDDTEAGPDWPGEDEPADADDDAADDGTACG